MRICIIRVIESNVFTKMFESNIFTKMFESNIRIILSLGSSGKLVIWIIRLFACFKRCVIQLIQTFEYLKKAVIVLFIYQVRVFKSSNIFKTYYVFLCLFLISIISKHIIIYSELSNIAMYNVHYGIIKVAAMFVSVSLKFGTLFYQWLI